MSSPPTGTVTFLFTDIEGSTKLAQEHPVAWETTRRRHLSIIRAAAEQQHGHVFQVIGDAFCIAFPTALYAVDAAVAAQQTLQRESWGGTPVRVRMGLHTGAAEFRDGEYTGYLTLAQVQRVMSSAYGGQTLLSNATAGLLDGQLPAAVSLRDMGEHRLKGLLNPERLWQVVAPELPQDFPPLQSLNAIPNNLPIQVTSFVGREPQLAELQTLLGKTRLLTLTGSGGTGKTRLSLQLAADVLGQYKDGVWFVELAPLSDPALLPQAVANALGVREEPGRPLQATLMDWLRAKQLLLILDNCEHLLGACAQFADALMRSGRDTHILCSSREALGIAGELAWRVPSLEVPSSEFSVLSAESKQTTASLSTLHSVLSTQYSALLQYAAVRLFVERATFANAAFRLTDANAPAVAQICYRLDGIPLAIELAAVRVKLFPPEQIATRLDDRFRLLTGGSRTALPRQQTLRSLIDWSHNLLSEPERVLLRRLSVFAGGWTLEAAEAVCGSETMDVLDLLTHLVDKSLVLAEEQAGSARYRMLETIRQYAREKLLDAGEGDALRDQHLRVYVHIAEQAESLPITSQRIEALPRLLSEHDNLRAALEWACLRNPAEAQWLAGLLRWFWHHAGYLHEAREWYNRVLALTRAAHGPRPEAAALLGAGMILVDLNDLNKAAELLEQALVLWRGLDDRRLAESLLWLGATRYWLGQFDAALAVYEGHETILRAMADPVIAGIALSFWGLALARVRGDYSTATALHAEGLALGKRGHDPDALGTINQNLGHLTAWHGDYELSRRYYVESLQWRRQSGTPWLMAAALANLGDAVCLLAEYGAAGDLYTESLALSREVGDQYRIARALGRLGYLAVERGDRQAAAALLAESMEIWRQRSSQAGVARCLIGYAELWRLAGRAEQAVQLLGYVTGAAQLQLEFSPIHQVEAERCLAAARSQLATAACDVAWAEGRALTMEQAINFALSEDL